MKTTPFLFALGLFLLVFSACEKENVKPDQDARLNTQSLTIDMQTFSPDIYPAAFLVFDEKKNAFIPTSQKDLNDPEARIPAVIRPYAEDDERWVLASVNDPALNSYLHLSDEQAGSVVSQIRFMDADEYERSAPKDQKALGELFNNADQLDEGTFSPVLEPTTVFLVKDSQGNHTAIKIEICVEGSSWKVCITIEW